MLQTIEGIIFAFAKSRDEFAFSKKNARCRMKRLMAVDAMRVQVIACASV